jgi:hypothetical protein
MSAICQRLESAIIRWLLRSADPTEDAVSSFALATEATAVTVTPYGLLVHYGDSATFNLNFYAGESEEKQELPKLVVAASQGAPVEGCWNIHTIPVEITLAVSADSSSTVDSVAFMDQTSRWAHDLIAGTRGMMDGIEAAEPTLVVSHVTSPEIGRAPDGRMRVHRWQFDVVASMGR